MRLIDADRYREDFINSRCFEPLKILDMQPTVDVDKKDIEKTKEEAVKEFAQWLDEQGYLNFVGECSDYDITTFTAEQILDKYAKYMRQKNADIRKVPEKRLSEKQKSIKEVDIENIGRN